MQQTSSKRPALARVFRIHFLEVCWTFARSWKHSITNLCPTFRQLHGGVF